MFLESFWNKFSFDLLPTLPLELGFCALLGIIMFVFIPTYIAYAKQSMQRKKIYLFSIVDFVCFYICIFTNVEDFYFDRGTITIFAKTLWLLLFLWSIIDITDKTAILYRNKTFVKKYISHPLEAGATYFIHLIFALLPLKIASWLGGKLARVLGKFQRKYNSLMDENLNIAFENISKKEKAKIKQDVWEMMGRYVAEPAHFNHIYHHHEKYLSFEGDEILDELKGKPYIVMISHSGTMGLISIPFALHGAPCSIIYKYPSNNLTNNLVKKSFGDGIGKLKFIDNTPAGTKVAMKTLKKGETILAVPDQKFKTGISTKFFGKNVKSPVGVAKLATHFDCPILPIQIVREKGVKHKIIFHKPFNVIKLKDSEQSLIKTTQKINDVIEGWIKENPSQWFWVHDRWNIKRKLFQKKGKNAKTKNNT